MSIMLFKTNEFSETRRRVLCWSVLERQMTMFTRHTSHAEADDACVNLLSFRSGYCQLA